MQAAITVAFASVFAFSTFAFHAGRALNVERQGQKDAMHLDTETISDSDNHISPPRTDADTKVDEKNYERRNCCVENGMRETCLSLCQEPREFLCHRCIICNFEYLHILNHCLEGKALDVGRQDLKESMHVGFETIYDPDKQMSRTRTGSQNITIKSQRLMYRGNSAVQNTMLPWLQIVIPMATLFYVFTFRGHISY